MRKVKTLQYGNKLIILNEIDPLRYVNLTTNKVYQYREKTMTENQSAQLVKNPNTKKAMAVLARFAKKELAYKEAEKEAKAATELIKEAMLAGGVDKVTVDIPGFTGYITLAERTNYRVERFDQVLPEYLKEVLDTDKVKAKVTLTGELPAGVTESKTQYITKKFKAVEENA